MTLSSMLVSRDCQEVSVLECILGGLHINVDVEPELDRAMAKLARSKVDALIVDSDLAGTSDFLRSVKKAEIRNSVPLVIISGVNGRKKPQAKDATFLFEKPISVEQAVHVLSAARNMILEGRLRYHRQLLKIPVSVSCGSKRMRAHLTNVSQGGIGLHRPKAASLNGPLEVSFALPGTKRAMRFHGEVAWQDAQGNTGIRFLDAAQRAKRDLQLWLEREYLTH